MTVSTISLPKLKVLSSSSSISSSPPNPNKPFKKLIAKLGPKSNISISNQKVPNKNELKDYLNNNKVWGKYALPASKWYGFRFKTIDDEVDEI